MTALRNSVLLFAVVVCGLCCRRQAANLSFSKGTLTTTTRLNDTNRIRIAVYTYLIERPIKPQTDCLLFIAANEDELTLLKAKFPHCVIKPVVNATIVNNQVRDKESGKEATLLAVQWITTTNSNQSSVNAGFFSRSGITYDFELGKEGVWKIKHVSEPTIADVF